MAKRAEKCDVLVLGEHPAALLAAMLLRTKPALRVIHASIPDERVPDRLVLINPAFSKLARQLDKLKKKLSLTAIHSMSFLADKTQDRADHSAKSVLTCVGSYAELRKRLCELAKTAGVRLANPQSLGIDDVDEHGLHVTLDEKPIDATALLLTGDLPEGDARKLGLCDPWPGEVLREYSFVRLRGQKWNLGAKPSISMSLELGDNLNWAWLLPGKGEVQLSVEHTPDGNLGKQLMGRWLTALRRHGVISHEPDASELIIKSLRVPASGALSREGVANRTLLFGPAGGFYSACMEDIYPNCWSAIFAVQTVRSALQEPHFQDALRPFRESWGTTLGEYLRGPQQNLRFLLPLIYRNPVMTARMSESILLGRSVVR